VRLGFDATALGSGKGNARSQYEFLKAAAEIGVERLTAYVAHGTDTARLPSGREWRYVKVQARPAVIWEQLRLPRAARRAGLDVVLTLSERAALWGPPRVLYIFEHPRHRARRAREVGVAPRQRLVDALTVALFRLALPRAAAVLAGSEATARDLSPIAAQVVYAGVSAVFSPRDAARSYFLHLATSDPRENSEVVLDAYARLAERPGLVVASNPPDSLRDHAARLGLGDDVRWLGYQTDEALADLYRGALAYVDPSLYEGFGFQAAEALACGTPVVASNVTSLPEVVGDAGILVDPLDVDGFAEAMRRLSADAGLRSELGEKAVAQAARFSWERTVRDAVEACRSVVGA
jgi:glycosyltransferase involved in cell wall biosynthesis